MENSIYRICLDEFTKPVNKLTFKIQSEVYTCKTPQEKVSSINYIQNGTITKICITLLQFSLLFLSKMQSFNSVFANLKSSGGICPIIFISDTS